ncbi:hypothetical protein [Marinobacter sp. ELB17]|uniref:hypothetical protein n=1 Tax=Marinobacter sp. ELB17 TaxID=270374 RepID=UPI0000F3759E|nr:hypothetical protein [Marinobacter sp. ELB17]EBA00536.1 pantothenate permease [Marinobacter sp. ELB17]
MVPAIIGAFYWRRRTAAGVLVSVIGAGLFVVYAYINGGKVLEIPAGIWGVPLSTLLFVGVSLLTEAPTAVADEFPKEANNHRKTAQPAASDNPTVKNA